MDCHNARHDHDITDGRDEHGLSRGEPWIIPLVVGTLLFFLIHIIGIIFLLTEPVGSLHWFGGAGYLVLLGIGILFDPRGFAVLYGTMGVVSVVLVTQISMDTANGMDQSTLYLSTWIPALLAALW